MSARVFELAAYRQARRGDEGHGATPVARRAGPQALDSSAGDAIAALETMVAACHAWRDKLRGMAAAARSMARNADTLASQAGGVEHRSSALGALVTAAGPRS